MMGGRTLVAGAMFVALVLEGCLPKTPPPPSYGYGAPYKGTGETIFVKDSRSDWDISEGKQPLTAEHALEAAGDEEYETRRQIAKAHNEHLYRVGKQHRSTARVMIYSSLVLIGVGLIGGTLLAVATKSETITPATDMMPAVKVVEPSATSKLASTIGTAMGIAGGVGVSYGLYGAIIKPPYYAWRVPAPMNRPAYIRQQVEPYNDRLTPANPIPRTRPTGPMLPGQRPGVRPRPMPGGQRPPASTGAPPPHSPPPPPTHRKRPRGGR
jgi:hypothetical protein